MDEILKNRIKAVKDYTKQILKNEVSNDLKNHNWSATKSNREVFKQIEKDMNISDHDKATIMTSLYFLYTGYSKAEGKPYANSVDIAVKYMTNNGYSQQEINEISGCLRTRSEHTEPSTLVEKVFADTINSYYGMKGLKKRIKSTWEERNYLRYEEIDYLTSLEKKLEKIESHEFQTHRGKQLFTFKKMKNIEKLRQYISKKRNKNGLSSNKTAMTMFKTASRNHIDLINIADKKAGIMISINAILLTLMIPILGSYIIDVTRFIVPSIILILTCGIAVILATLATRPQPSDGDVSDKEKIKGEKSLFFFGNFFKMEKEDYKTAVKDVIVRDITLENSIITDLYDMGYVLGIKYNRLRWCYLIFAIGIGLTLVTFIVSFTLFPEI